MNYKVEWLRGNILNIRLLILDVDGTLTDGSIYMGQTGELMKRFSCQDGLAIIFLKEVGITPIIITARDSAIVSNRAKELGITDVYQGQKEKSKLIDSLCAKFQTDLEHVAYIGDDINDLRFMKKCGTKMCPQNAHAEIKAIADYISPKCGGNGAVRDCIEYLFKLIGCYEKFIRLQ